MKHYTDRIPRPLAEKLKAAGMPIEYHPLFTPEIEGADQSVGLIRPTYAEVFDWLMERRIFVCIGVDDFKKDGKWIYGYDYFVGTDEGGTLAQVDFVQMFPTWHEAADAAIEKALTLI